MKTEKFISRRNFVGTALTATAAMATGTALAQQAVSNSNNASEKDKSKHPYNPRTFDAMPTNSFGKTGYKVGILSLGGQAALEEPGKEDLSEKIINRAIDLGVNYIDTAASYGNGLSQENIGRVMKTRRNEVFLASKCQKFTYDDAMAIIEDNLKKLQTDHIDLLQFHNLQRKEQFDQIFADNGAIHAFEKAKEQGMIRYIGITGHYEPLILKLALERYNFDALLLAVNAADIHYLSFKNYLLPEALKRGIATISMKVATRGRMLSTWTPPPVDQQPARMATGLTGTITIKEALEYNMSLPVSTTIIGVDNVEQIEEDVQIASGFSPLSEEQMREIEHKTLPIVRQGLYFRRWDMGV